MSWVSLNNLTRFYTKLKEKFYLKTEVDTKVNTLNTAINNISTVYYGDGVDSAIVPLNADQLQGHPASYFVTRTDIDTKLTIFNNAGFKNSIFRGQHLGTSITTDQYNAIANGSFEDLYLGDYWTIGGHNWRIWGFNTFLRDGDSECTSPHILLMPDDNYLHADGSTTRYMKDTNDTSGGYKATKFFTTYASQIYNELTAYFGSHILSHRELISNATSNGLASGWEWVNVYVGMPTEVNMFGTSVWGGSTVAVGGSGHNIGVNKTAFPLAIINPSFITNRENYYLRDVVGASSFADVYFNGGASYDGASDTWVGVRPYILIS